MKPLTIEELKALPKMEYVYIINKEYNFEIYRRKSTNDNDNYFIDCNYCKELGYAYSDYGSKWIAYKNKEQAENKTTNGSLLRMLSNEELADFLCSEDFQKLKMSYSSSVLGIRDWLGTELNEEEAERRLSELKGE